MIFPAIPCDEPAGAPSLPAISPPRASPPAAPDAGIAGPVLWLTPEPGGEPGEPDLFLHRRAIAEDRRGEALLLQIQVVDARGAPLPEVRVDVWHCDAQGRYGGPGRWGTEGPTFLRGSQRTDDRGIVEFDTIVPGRHGSAATQIHLGLWLDDGPRLTGRMILPVPLVTAIHDTFATYSHHAAFDGPFPGTAFGKGQVARMEPDGRRYVARLAVGVGGAQPPHGCGGW